MTSIETVQERGQGAYQFDTYYESLCALQSSVPLASVKANLSQHVLEINADKIRLTDWAPILKAVRINKSLEKIAIYSFFDADPESLKSCSGSVTPQRKSSYTPIKRKLPPAHTKDITYQLCKAIKDCLSCSENIKSLILEGLPFRSRDISLLSKGISRSVSLKEISLECSHVGDIFTVICDGLKNASTVNMINLSGCGLADGAIEAISKVVKHQAIMRHSEAWKSSLRYRAPDLDCMPGLRRITLNRNPLLGDNGAKALSEALKDDLWLKAVDLQECGLTDVGAEYILDALRLNSTVLVVDIRGNHMVNRTLVERIIQQVMINSDGKTTQYSWLPVDSDRSKKQASIGRKRTSSSKRSTPYKTPSKARTMVISPSRKRSAPITGSPPITPRTVPKQRGLPWRTAERAHVHKFIDGTELHTPSKPSHSGTKTITVHRDGEGDSELVDSTAELSLLWESQGGAAKTNPQTLTLIKELQAENISLKRRLNEESTARLAAEDRALELARDNRRLHSDLRRSSLSGGVSAAADEELLTQVEAAFSKFNQFLDLVRDTGLGHLIHEAGLDMFAGTSSPIPAPIKHSMNTSGRSLSGNPPLEFSDYVLERQIALQSDDIIKPTACTDPPKKSYAEIMSGSPTIAKYASAAGVADKPAAPKSGPVVGSAKEKKKKSKERAPAEGDLEGSNLQPGTYKIKAFELKDVSELETPKLSPRPTIDVTKSMEGIPDLPEQLSDRTPKQGAPAADVADDMRDRAPAGSVGVSQSYSAMSQSKSGASNMYSDDFGSVSESAGRQSPVESVISSDDDRHGEVIHLSEPDLSAISSSESSEERRKSGMNNIMSLSQLDSVDDDQVSGGTKDDYTADFDD